MGTLRWPERWQPEAIEAVEPYIGSDERLDIWVDPPETATSGTRIGGHLFAAEDGTVMVIHDRSGRLDVHPWRLLAGPVLVVQLLRPNRRPTTLYRHPLWPKQPGRP